MARWVCSGDWHLGPYPFGKLNPKTGLNTRLEDFLDSARQVVDLTLKEGSGLILTGDIFKDGNPSQTIVREFIKLIKPLLDAGKQVVIVVGNHPKGAYQGLAHALEPFQVLGMEGFYIYDSIHLLGLPGIDIITVPYFYAHEKEPAQIKAEIEKMVKNATRREGVYRLILGHFFTDKSIPEYLEESGFVMPVGFLNKLGWADAVVAGHPHGAMRLKSDPVVYHPGSINCVSFNEKDELKYCLVLDTETKKVEFVELRTRTFLEYVITVEKPELDDILRHLDPVAIAGAVVKLKLTIPENILASLDMRQLESQLSQCFSVIIDTYIVRQDNIATIEFKDVTLAGLFEQYMDEAYEGGDKEAVKEKGREIIGAFSEQ